MTELSDRLRDKAEFFERSTGLDGVAPLLLEAADALDAADGLGSRVAALEADRDATREAIRVCVRLLCDLLADTEPKEAEA